MSNLHNTEDQNHHTTHKQEDITIIFILLHKGI